MTGCVGNSVSASSYDGCANAYNTTIGYNGSTTGNISGIYDMSGGAWEYVAGYVSGKKGSSGFTTDDLTSEVYSKYLDVYNNTEAIGYTSYNYRILGDATGEMGPFYYYRNNWYSDYSHLVYSSCPWFLRGGHYSDAGQFYFLGDYGGAYASISARLVLSPKI
jgi:hypothetical protein